MLGRLVRLSLAAVVVLTLAGCATVTNSLGPDQIRSFRYTETTVSYAPNAFIWWGDGERAYAATKGVAATEAETLAKTPEGQAYLHGQITSKVKAAMTRHLSGSLTGSRPVRVDVVIKNVTIASAVQRVVLGGSYLMQGDINLIDAKTGAVLQSYPAKFASAAAGQGIAQVLIENAIATADPIDRLIDNFAESYQQWLIPA